MARLDSSAAGQESAAVAELLAMTQRSEKHPRFPMSPAVPFLRFLMTQISLGFSVAMRVQYQSAQAADSDDEIDDEPAVYRRQPSSHSNVKPEAIVDMGKGKGKGKGPPPPPPPPGPPPVVQRFGGQSAAVGGDQGALRSALQGGQSPLKEAPPAKPLLQGDLMAI